ncbi:mitotic checkpoint serine/threonine-protein kinase BUB1 isoform X2 [Clarias gariepinus]|uniref:mitotic checkpoint serine/threonine-protein kinase BUB1 isoform X2 n=1 Tax=Clarias gariepinus TaxID=13013 RepID=UPI00234C7DA9|nr:mitotic checkpoint serine/threonine-protein kinase BUB1 isoform X2 [Clarias gariepinus]
MDVQFYLQRFESGMSSYTGDDPLDSWDKFVDFLDSRLPPEERSKVCMVLERLVQTFLQDKRYHNDLRFINHCIRCASYQPDPVRVYGQVHGCGVGTRSAALYIGWAQQCEGRSLILQAEQVYQRALENRAEPHDTLQTQYRLFQSRTGRPQTSPSAVSTALQDSQLVNQQLRQRDSVQPHCKDVATSQVLPGKTIHIISRSENRPRPGGGGGGATQCVSMYCVGELVCEGAELSFEELRARHHFNKLRQQELQRQQEEVRRRYEEEEQDVVRMKRLLEELNSKLTDEPQVLTGPRLIQTTDQSGAVGGPCVSEASLTHHTDTAFTQRLQHTHTHSPVHQSVCVSREEALGVRAECTGHTQQPEPLECDADAQEEAETHVNADVSHGGFNHSHVTPNTSLGLLSATPSRALPSPTVNTREALDLIGNMFQGPTLFQDSVFDTTHVSTAPEEDSFERSCRVTGCAPPSVKAPPSAPFMIYQDENNEKKSLDPDVKPQSAAVRALMEIPVSKANVTPLGAESLTDESTMWGPGHAPMAPLPNHTQDFALFSHLVSTPLAPVTPCCRDTHHHSQAEGGADENPYQRQPAKLSPILEQSPLEEKQRGGGGGECTLTAQGTIVGECVSLQGHAHSLTQHSQNHSAIGRQALAPLCGSAPPPFSDRGASSGEDLDAWHKPSWSVYQSPHAETGGRHSERETERDQVSSYLSVLPPDSTHMPRVSLSGRTSSGSDGTRSVSLARSSVAPHAPASNPDLTSSRLRPFGELEPETSSSLNVFREAEVDSAHSPLSDPEEADLLLPERSFNMTRSVSLMLENLRVQQRKSLTVPRSPGREAPMSPEPAPGFGWLRVESPVRPTEPDLDVMAESPRLTSGPGWTVYSDRHSSSVPERDVPMSPAPEPGLNWICSESPVWGREADLDVMMSPPQKSTGGRGGEGSRHLGCEDVPMSPSLTSAPPTTPVLVSDPWDEALIVSLLAGLRTPLTSHPSLSTWSCCVPSISPKLTVQMGDTSLRVDSVVGQGAFATVYQASTLNSAHRVILKVQKPSNPWEFYINGELDSRVEPRARHLYNRLHAAHLFSNGSVLLGELHTCGTLLNVINVYKSRSEKVMPPPLVLYFTVCILDMVERLHAAHVIHADIKPDNFMLGDRFLENKDLSEENLEHGLVLIDFGQSIDMTLFPDGAQFTAHCMTSGFQCTEMLSGRPWTYQTDYFGVAGTVYCMLFGSYMQVRNDGGVWKTGGVFKRNPHSDLWQEFFHVLLNVPDCNSLPSLRALRERVSAALLENYSTKLLGLKNRLVVQILESRSSRR